MKETAYFFLVGFFGILTALSLIIFAVGVVDFFGMAIGIMTATREVALHSLAYAVMGFILFLINACATLLALDK